MLDPLIAVLHPLVGDSLGWPVLAGNSAQVIVHAHLVVEVVKTCCQIRIVPAGVVALTDEKEFPVFLAYCLNSPCEELDRYHLRHIHAYAVYAFSGPEKQDVPHLDPG